MKKKWLAGLMALLCTFSLAACAQEDKKADGEKMQALEEFTVVLDWYPNAVHSFIYEAMEKGYYEEEGLDVKIQFPSNTNDAISLTAAGKADIGFYYLQDIAMARVNQDIPVKAVGTVVQAPLNVVISLQEKNITSPKDLEGKTIGYAGTELSEAIVKEMVESSGASMEHVTLIDVGFDLMSSMTTENVDATIGGMENHEVPAMEEEGFALNYFSPCEYGVPNYYELVFVTGENQLKTKSDQIGRFLRACEKGFEDMKDNPEEALQILLDNQNAENFPLTKSVEKRSFDVLLPIMETEQAPFLTQDKAVWQENIDWLYEKGLLKEKIDAAEIVTEIDWQG